MFAEVALTAEQTGTLLLIGALGTALALVGGRPGPWKVELSVLGLGGVLVLFALLMAAFQRKSVIDVLLLRDISSAARAIVGAYLFLFVGLLRVGLKGVRSLVKSQGLGTKD